jgi:hypothetical protein
MHFVNLTVDTVGVYSWWTGYPRRSARRFDFFDAFLLGGNVADFSEDITDG